MTCPDCGRETTRMYQQAVPAPSATKCGKAAAAANVWYERAEIETRCLTIALASERESRLRAERELNEAALATSQRLITLAESLARAEREGDEARAQMYAATTATAKREEDVAYAQKRIEELEAVLRGWWCGNHECSRSLCRNIDAALSSPAVTTGDEIQTLSGRG